MIKYQRLINTCLLWLVATIAIAQTSSNSPYTRYGFGELSDQHFGNSKAMGGIAYGLRNGYQINAANPASYTKTNMETTSNPITLMQVMVACSKSLPE